MFERKIRVLLVCTENICRSPMAEGLLRQQLRDAGVGHKFKVSSAGTLSSQPGSRPDRRAQKVAAAAGVELGGIRSRRVTGRDLARSDIILAMDHANMQDLFDICPQEHCHKIGLLLRDHPEQGMDEVPDPYYGSYEGFVQVFQIIEEAVACLVPNISVES